MAITIEDIERWNPADIERVFATCAALATHCGETSVGLTNLDVFATWAGDAAAAARTSFGKTRLSYDQHALEVLGIAYAAKSAAGEIEQVKATLKAIRADADRLGFQIDPTTGKVSDPTPPSMQGWSQADKDVYRDSVRALQVRINDLLLAADRADDNLAAAINAASGELPVTDIRDTPNAIGESSVNRHQNQVSAFTEVYGRAPRTANEWRMAEALDSETYDPKNNGANATVVVGTIEPRPGHGVVRANLYIPGGEAQNLTVNPGDVFGGRAFPNNYGDNRGPNPSATAEQSRVSIYVDYENGVVVARQNPTVVTSGPNPPKADVPEVRVAQAPDGSVRVNYFGTDTYQPEIGKRLGVGVEGDITMRPNVDGSVDVGGTVGSFPSAEVYQYHQDGTTSTLANYEATTSEWGPLTNLPMGPNREIGVDVPQVGEPPKAPPQMGYPGTQQGSAPQVGTELGSADDPPRVKIVGIEE
ncbi:hypothetical protein [Williamsia sp. D3]|uniref:hypothetical protein n=1 Tax=Williamsia sp. D3 TaxID=1313067 RepID=UPI0003D2E142|nr:hypothetical protein [Williamsia sp. D3]ETD31751.1 hypothetical protein W823_17480 [Williamsia sp. D3]